LISHAKAGDAYLARKKTLSPDFVQISRTILTASEDAHPVAEGIYILPAQGNAFAVETGDSVDLVDAGPDGGVTGRMIESLRRFTNLPVSAICYSHGHLGYNDGVHLWQQHNASRNEAPATLIAHENCLRRYRETEGLQRVLAKMQFPGLTPAFSMVDPTLTFSARLSLPARSRRIDLL
jgi:uncharacterized sulfatase